MANRNLHTNKKTGDVLSEVRRQRAGRAPHQPPPFSSLLEYQPQDVEEAEQLIKDLRRELARLNDENGELQRGQQMQHASEIERQREEIDSLFVDLSGALRQLEEEETKNANLQEQLREQVKANERKHRELVGTANELLRYQDLFLRARKDAGQNKVNCTQYKNENKKLQLQMQEMEEKMKENKMLQLQMQEMEEKMKEVELSAGAYAEPQAKKPKVAAKEGMELSAPGEGQWSDAEEGMEISAPGEGKGSDAEEGMELSAPGEGQWSDAEEGMELSATGEGKGSDARKTSVVGGEEQVGPGDDDGGDDAEESDCEEIPAGPRHGAAFRAMDTEYQRSVLGFTPEEQEEEGELPVGDEEDAMDADSHAPPRAQVQLEELHWMGTLVPPDAVNLMATLSDGRKAAIVTIQRALNDISAEINESSGIRAGARPKTMDGNVSMLVQKLSILRVLEMRQFQEHQSFGSEEMKDILNRPGCPTDLSNEQTRKRAIARALKATGVACGLDIGFEAQPKGVIVGDVKLRCHLTKDYIDCNIFTCNAGQSANVHVSMESLGTDPNNPGTFNKVFVQGSVTPNAVRVGEGVTVIFLMEKKGNLREFAREAWKDGMKEENERRLQGAVGVCTSGIISKSVISVVKFIQQELEHRTGKDQPVYVAVDQNYEGLLTVARLVKADIKVTIVSGLPEMTDRLGIDTSKMPKADDRRGAKKKLRNVARHIGLDDEKALHGMACVNVEQMLSGERLLVTDMILAEMKKRAIELEADEQA